MKRKYINKILAYAAMLFCACSILSASAGIITNGVRVSTDVMAHVNGYDFNNNDVISFCDFDASAILDDAFSKSGRIRIDALFVYGASIIFSSDVDFREGGIDFADEDLVAYYPISKSFSMFWDGSSHGVAESADVDAAIMRDGTNLYLSVDVESGIEGTFTWVSPADLLYVDFESSTSKVTRIFTKSELGLSDGDDIDALFLDGVNLYFSLKSYYESGVNSALPSEVIVFNTNTMTLSSIRDLQLEKKVVLSALDFPLDTDGDGLTDYEEETAMDEAASKWPGTNIRLIPNGPSFSGVKDSDGDGADDGEEAMAGTSPIDPDDYLHVTSIEFMSADWCDISWASVPGKVYDVYISSNLISGAFLPDIFLSNITATNSTTTISHNNANIKSWFYKVYLSL